jgi:quercetin dioxygenase-like cupin family protein
MPFVNLDEIAAQEIIPGFHGRFVHTDQVTIAHFQIDEGATLPGHAHPHEQVTTVLEGQLEMTVGGETRVVSAGQCAVIPGGVTHSARALTACRVIDVFHPARDDYR